MRKVIYGIAFVAILCICSSCKKSEADLLIGTWNWHNTFSSDYYAGHAVMTYTFTKNGFEIKWDDEVAGDHSDHYYVNGTYAYDKESKTLAMTPTTQNWYGGNNWHAQVYSVQTLNETTLILKSLSDNTIYTFTRK